VLLCELLVLAGNRFWFYILLMYLEYNTVVGCVSFLVLAGNSFWYVLSVQNSCVVVSVFWLWQEIVLKMGSHYKK
jgi:hypothetical protein